MKELHLTAATLLLFVLARSAAPADWPQFHGPNQDNKSVETGLLKEWPEGGPKLLWTASGIGKGYSTVSVADGLIYTAGMTDNQTYVFAFDLEGKLRWKAANGESWSAEKQMRWAIGYNGSRSTPTIHDGIAYHLGELGRLAALDAKTGQESWSEDLFQQFEAKCPKYGLAESVRIDGDKLICCPAGAKGYMVALEKKTGKLVWVNTELSDPVGYCSAIFADFAGLRQVVTMSAKAVFGVDVKTGKLLWQVPHTNERSNSATDPIFHDGYVYASTGYGAGSILIKLGAADSGVGAEKVWSSTLLDNHHGGVVLLDGYLYGSGHKAAGWFCLDLKTGEPKYQEPGKGSLTYADGMLYCYDEKGLMELVESTPEARRVASSFQVPKGGEGAYWAHPVVCGGRLYVRHADNLYAYDIKAK